jgi:hypothetical protein
MIWIINCIAGENKYRNLVGNRLESGLEVGRVALG